MPYSMPNNNTHTNIPPLESLYVLFGMALSAVNPSEFARFREFVQQNPEFAEKYPQTFPSPNQTQAASSAVDEAEAKQKWIDRVFEYVAPSLFVTSVLASGELVGSTIWGISKYVSKDIIWDTLGATTAAVILQSADLVGYKEEAQELFGIKTPEKRAGFAQHLGGKAGKAIGAVAGTALSLAVESATVGLIAPPLVPLVTGVGLVIGGIVGEIVGAGVVSGLNNLFFSTIGTVSASYQGTKQKGGKFVERIKHSREVKRARKQEKAAPEVKKEDKKKDEKNAVPVNAQGAGAPEVPPAQLLLKGGNDVSGERPNNNAALTPVSQAIKGPFVRVTSRGGNQQGGKGTYTPLVIGGQRKNNTEEPWLLKMFKKIIPKEVVRNIINTGNVNKRKDHAKKLEGGKSPQSQDQQELNK